ncbi:MAG: helix-turn-helix transcriptional regulator [Halopseudomonas sp.]|uniref:helix-turn-helix transcriptional regulator n=1 Tax=Halopseudomonas sp. TaxID=2901191 RepID=UPI003001D526
MDQMETIEYGGLKGFIGAGRLSFREVQFSLMVACGMTDKQIAKEVGLQPDSVGKAIYRAMGKLEVTRRAQLVKECMTKSIITPLLLMLAICMMAVQATPDHKPINRTRIVRVKGGARRDADVSVFRIC